MSRAQSLFHEEQRLQFLRLRVMLALPPLALLALAVWQIGLGHPWGEHPMSNGGLIGLTIFLWLVYFRLITARLVTDVQPTRVSIGLRGLWPARHISLSDITNAKVVTFQPMRDFGGYGIRSSSKGKAYLAAGIRGVRLELKNGSAITIGSERPEELSQALRN
jgi:hypothetical protein